MPAFIDQWFSAEAEALKRALDNSGLDYIVDGMKIRAAEATE